MFSTKIYVLSVFVFCLFNLGQAAPIIDEISPLATRDVAELDARGIFDALFHKKLSKENQKKVDNATDDGACHLYNAYTALQKSHENALKDLKGKQLNGTNDDKAVKKAYAKLAKQYKKLSKDAKNEATKHAKELKKHGVTDVAARCGSLSNTHSAFHKSTKKSHATHSDAHTSEATPKHDSHPEPPSESHSGSPATPEN
jgi:hypothetical protein